MSSSLAHNFSSTACLAALDWVGVGEEPYVLLAYTLGNVNPKSIFRDDLEGRRHWLILLHRLPALPLLTG
jgi:hypothetical protein